MRGNKITDLCAFGVEANLHLIQAVSKPEHSPNVIVTAVPSIWSTKVYGGTSSTQYLVAKPIQNTKRQIWTPLLPFYASPITFIEIFGVLLVLQSRQNVWPKITLQEALGQPAEASGQLQFSRCSIM